MGSEAPATVLPAPAPASPRASLPVDGSVVKMKVGGDNEPGSDGAGRPNVPVLSAPPPFAPFCAGLALQGQCGRCYQVLPGIQHRLQRRLPQAPRRWPSQRGGVCSLLFGPENLVSRLLGARPIAIWPRLAYLNLTRCFVLRGARSRGGWGGFGVSPFFGCWSSWRHTGAPGRSGAGCIIRQC